MTARQLGLVREALTSVGMDISYACEDLVFLEHNGFLLQFTENERELLVHINCNALEEKLADAVSLLQRKAEEVGLAVSMGKRYRLHQDDDEETIRLEFF